jgi:hypothetical protein
MQMNSETIRAKLCIRDINEVEGLLRRTESHFRNTCHWIVNNVERDAKAVIFHRILCACTNYIKIAADNLNGHASVLGLATRNIYELRLRVEHMITCPQELDSWQSEAATDKIQLMEAILGIQATPATDPRRQILTNEIDRLRNLLRKHGLTELTRLPSIASIAGTLGREEEHRSLFKLFSKLVHPSSYLVNDYENAASDETFLILQSHVQLYSWELFTRISDALHVPEDVRHFDF